MGWVEPPRPVPEGVAARLGAWIRWFGPMRVVSAVLGVVVLAATAMWAISAPAPAAVTGSVPSGSNVAAPSSGDGIHGGETTPVTLVGRPPFAEPPAAALIVHVAGAVAAPGVHELSVGSRVVDAVAAAGGPLTDAALDALNLAAPLIDGQRIHVPRQGEVVVAHDPLPLPDVPAGPVDVNRASTRELESLPGIGPAIAAEIVADRERHGAFASVDELLRVRGIGPAKLGAIRDQVVAG